MHTWIRLYTLTFRLSTQRKAKKEEEEEDAQGTDVNVWFSWLSCSSVLSGRLNVDVWAYFYFWYYYLCCVVGVNKRPLLTHCGLTVFNKATGSLAVFSVLLTERYLAFSSRWFAVCSRGKSTVASFNLLQSNLIATLLQYGLGLLGFSTNLWLAGASILHPPVNSLWAKPLFLMLLPLH